MSRWALYSETCPLRYRQIGQSHGIHYMSKVYVPAGYKSKVDQLNVPEGHKHLLSAGYLRPSLAGVFSILPLGQRVLDKLERRIDDLMDTRLQASKMSLPILASRTLWESTGRWNTIGDELFRLKDRGTTELCLSPTHEESVTKLVAGDLNGYRHLPIRIYQIGRKFRDEMRPRGGLLRGREFLMKDLYTFDAGEAAAHATYEEVKSAYTAFFEELGVDFVVAEADSGGIGGDKSHEFHLPSPAGADTLLKCSSCDYVANQELARTKVEPLFEQQESAMTLVFGHQDLPDTVMFKTEIPKGREVNPISLLRAAKQLDPSVTRLVPVGFQVRTETNQDKTLHQIDRTHALRVEPGDACPKCEEGKLKGLQAIEIGHTFHLGRKYSEPLHCRYTNEDNKICYPEMGCHGIGLTRLLAALADTMSDQYGLQWPQGLAPYESVLITQPSLSSLGERLAKRFNIDAIDDRYAKSIAYRVRDMQLKGVPRVFLIGKDFWRKNKLTEDQDLSECSDEMLDDFVIGHAKIRGCYPREWQDIKVKDLRTA